MKFSTDDQKFMKLALQEAQTSLSLGDYPVGAAITVNGELWGTARNSLFTDERSTAHAEHNLIYNLSPRLRTQFRAMRATTICLYTTLEPCLMCLGIAVLHRISRIIIACPDPNGGTTGVALSTLGSFYRQRWPTIQIGLYQEQSCELIIAFLKTKKFHSWELMLHEFEAMKQTWQEQVPG